MGHERLLAQVLLGGLLLLLERLDGLHQDLGMFDQIVAHHLADRLLLIGRECLGRIGGLDGAAQGQAGGHRQGGQGEKSAHRHSSVHRQPATAAGWIKHQGRRKQRAFTSAWSVDPA